MYTNCKLWSPDSKSQRIQELSHSLYLATLFPSMQAMEFLRRLGFLPLGHVHTGNIYVEGDMCRLGGYENTLLGYRTHRYDLYSSRGKEFIDVIMFGS